eukprot:COSAG02_NODE_56623_length_284_cov_1.394595_1_plen_28_part_01
MSELLRTNATGVPTDTVHFGHESNAVLV